MRGPLGAPFWSTMMGRSTPVSAFGQFVGVGDGGGAAQKLRVGPVKRAGAAQTAQNMGDVRPEHAPVRVHLVHDHVFEVGEKRAPSGVVGQNADVQHVGVGQNDVRALFDVAALLRGRVAVVRGKADGGEQAEVVEFAQLILRKGFGGEQIKGAGSGVVQNGVYHGQIVAQGLAAGRRGDDGDVFAIARRVDRFRLMREQPRDALRAPVSPANCGCSGRSNSPYAAGRAGMCCTCAICPL